VGCFLPERRVTGGILSHSVFSDDQGPHVLMMSADLSDGRVGVRHSKDSEGPVLRFTPDEWRAFLGGVRNGEFDRFCGQ
jgi:hypothetical protein